VFNKGVHLLVKRILILCFVFGLMMAQWSETCRRIYNIDYQYMLCLLTEFTILFQILFVSSYV